MAQDFTRTAQQITNSATTIVTANSNDAVIGLILANFQNLLIVPSFKRLSLLIVVSPGF